jgi:hypothetical protein
MTTTPVRDWELERYLLGELDAARAAAIRAELTSDAGLRWRLQALEEANAATLEAHPPARVAVAIESRRAAQARTPPRLGARLSLWLVPAVAAAAVLLVVERRGPDVGTGDAIARVPITEEGRVKGAPGLYVYRLHGQKSEELGNGSVARAGDTLQLAYSRGDRAFGVVVSLDGNGGVTLHFPETQDGPTRLANGTVALPHAYELDAAPGFERFVFVTADSPIAVAEVLARARSLAHDREHAASAPLVLGKGLGQRSVLVRKQP